MAHRDPRDDIRNYLARPGARAMKPQALAKKLGVKKKRMPEFRAALDALIAAGEATMSADGGVVHLTAAPGMVVGVIKRIASGAGFLIPHQPADAAQPVRDVFIAQEDLHDAHTGDEALVKLLKRRRAGGQRCGRVEEVLVRASNHFVGTYFEQNERCWVRVDGNTFTAPILVDDPGAKGAQPDDKVVIEMLRFPTHYRAGEAVLTEVLGPRGEPGVDTLSIIREYELPVEFSEEAHEEARLAAQHFDGERHDDRLDLTRETIVTIDPADARDFDDAISLSREKNGHWKLGVHVADVAHFVPEDSALDRDARIRGTSVYLPQRVIPMIPELISNGLASLQQGKPRYAKSVFIEFDPAGTPLHSSFANSVIQVKRRFAYEEVLPVINDPERHKGRVPAKVRQLLARMHELAMILRQRRRRKGALFLELPEIRVDFDKDGRVIGAHEQHHDESHQIIEEFMLAANIAVATKLSDLDVPFLRRGHGEPNPLKLQAFANFVTALGFKLKNPQSRHELQAIIDQVAGAPLERAVNYSLLRSMKQAEYTAIDTGHYALAEDDYCHFTSPIRRYPDLQVHRLIDQVVTGERQARGPGMEELVRLGKHCSVTERRAADAERDLTKVKLLTYMSERLGEELEAIITGVERFGIFCQGVEIPAEGLIHVSSLPADDFYDFDQTTFSLIGRRTGREFRLGDKLRVKVAHVDVDRRELNFSVVAVSPVNARRRGDSSRRPSDGKQRRGRADGGDRKKGARATKRGRRR
ncbi:MAG: ribonuclease R [Planctomycetaceae bacterium]